MNMRKFGRRATSVGALAVAGLLAMAGCAAGGSDTDGGQGDDAAGLETVRIAYTPGSATLHLHMAEKLGYFEDHGIDIEATQGLDLPTWSAALGKQYDAVMATAGIFLDGANKLDLTAVAGIQKNTGDRTSAMIVRDPDINDIADLEGKRIGVATITGTTPLSLQYLMEQAGGDPESLQFVQVGFGVQPDQLAAGQVDAIVSASPFWIPAVEDPENRVIYDDVMYEGMIAIEPDQPTSANVFFVAQTPWADEHPDVVDGLRAALQEAIDYIYANPDEATDELVEWLQLEPEIAEQVVFEELGMTATVDAEEIAPIIKLSVEMGTIPEDAAPDLDARVLP